MLRTLCIFVTVAVAFEIILQVCFADGKGRGKRRRCPNACIRKFDDYQKTKVGPTGLPGRRGPQGLSISLPTCKPGEFLTSDGHRLICEKLDLASIYSNLGKKCLSGHLGCLSETTGVTPEKKSKKMIKFTKKNMVQMLQMDSWDAEAFYIGSSLFVGMSQLGRNSFVLYKWLVDEKGSGKFTKFQDFDVFQSRNWEPFKIDGEQYLVIASFQDNSVCPIYKWNSKQFVKFKGLPCSRAFDVEPFELDGVQHVAVANFDEDRGKPVVVFKWDGSGFTELQKFDITAQYVEVFKVNDETYLGISGILVGPYVKLYKWNGVLFVLQQTLQTAHHPYDLMGMSVGKETFLAVPTYETKKTTYTVMFRWNGKKFELYQNISSVEARRVVAISSPMMGKTSAYLAVINYAKNPVIYVWEGERKFLSLQELQAKGSRDISFFEMGGNVYLILSSQRRMEVFKGVAV